MELDYYYQKQNKKITTRVTNQLRKRSWEIEKLKKSPLKWLASEARKLRQPLR